ncbi:hypothetical protein EBB07_18630 [Paenibacillaceae bacterium]|nr:hypothetical protein EBB07_18630 [Paenibacillaceae bacterium]
MPEIVSLGPLNADGLLLTVLIAAVAGMGALSLWIRTQPLLKGVPWLDMFGTALFIWGICWKLGFLVWNPALLWERPLSLLVVRSGFWETLAGGAAACIYLLIAARRRQIKLNQLLGVLPYALVPALIVWCSLTSFPYYLPYALIAAGFYIYMIKDARGSASGGGPDLTTYLLGFGFGGLLASLFAASPPGAVLHLTAGLTGLQWLFIALIAAGIFVKPQRAIQTETGSRTVTRDSQTE